MVKVGDEVILMSAPGRFRVTAVEGDALRITNDRGVQKLVRSTNVRTVEPQSTANAAPTDGQ